MKVAKIINNYLIADLEKEEIENFEYKQFLKLTFSLNQIFSQLYEVQKKRLSSIGEGHKNYNEINNENIKIKKKLEDQDKKNNNLKKYLEKINNMIEESKGKSKNIKCLFMCNLCSEINVYSKI